MKTAIVNSSVIARTGRMDAGFHILLSEHQQLFEELMKLDEAKLVDLARRLPFDQRAFEAIRPQGGWKTVHLFKSDLDAWLGVSDPAKALASKRKKTDIAVYVAAAAQFAASKQLEEVLELAKQKKVMLENLMATIKSAQDVPGLVEAIKRSSGDGPCPSGEKTPASGNGSDDSTPKESPMALQGDKVATPISSTNSVGDAAGSDGQNNEPVSPAGN